MYNGSPHARPFALSLVDERPRNAGYRFELGVIEAELGRCREAWRQFNIAVDSTEIEAIAGERDRAMADLCPDFSLFEKWFSMRIISDPNYFNAPEGRFVEIFGLPFELDDDALPRKRRGVALALGVSRLPRRASDLVPSLAVKATLLDESEDNSWSLRPGIAWRRTRHRVETEIGTSILLAFGDDGIESRIPGIAGRLTLRPSERDAWHLDGSVDFVNSIDDSGDGRDIHAGWTWRRAMANGDVLTLHSSYGRQNREFRSDSFHIGSAGLSWSGSIGNGVGYRLHGALTINRARHRHPVFGRVRRDHIRTIGVDARLAGLEIPGIGIPEISVTRIVSDSTLSLHRYRKNGVSAGFSLEF